MTRAPRQSSVDPLEAAGNTLRRNDWADAADRLIEVAGQDPPSRTVVVIGEIKRGKSSLVNSLLGVPDAAAVDTDIATSAQLRFVPPSDETAVGDAFVLLPSGDRRSIDIADAHKWVTVDGEQSAELVDGQIPIGVEVCIEARRLPGTTIVDTPGVNGLDPRHVASAVSATEGARVLVMVCDAIAPISAAELRFLASVTPEIGSVVVAVTKTDKVMAEWRTVAEENRRLIAEHALQFAGVPVVGVSNLFARRAMALDGDRAESLWASSGVDELASVLDTMLADPADVVRRNAAQCAIVALYGLRAELEARKLAIDASPETRRELSAEQERLEELQVTQKEWAARLTQRLNRLQYASDARTKLWVDEFRKRWETTFDKLGVVDSARRSQQLAAQAAAEVGELVERIASELKAELSDLAVDLLGETLVQSPPLTAALAELDSVDLRAPREYRRWKGFVDPQLVTLAVSGAGLASLSGLGVPFIPIWGVLVVGFRATKFGKQSLTKWLTETLRQAQDDTAAAIRLAHNEFAPELRLIYANALAASLADAKRLVSEAAESARADAAERKRRLSAIDTELTRIDNICTLLAAP